MIEQKNIMDQAVHLCSHMDFKAICDQCQIKSFQEINQSEILKIKNEEFSIQNQNTNSQKSNDFQEQIIFMKNQFNQLFDKLINSFKEIYEAHKTELAEVQLQNFIPNTLHLEENSVEKEQFLSDIRNKLENSFDEIGKKFNNFLIDTQQILNNSVILSEKKFNGQKIQLICNQTLGINHGESYYLNGKDKKTAGHFNFNKKVGIWRELEGNIESIGQYRNGKKVGQWKQCFHKEPAGQGFYNDYGVKIGFWKEINQSTYSQQHQIVQQGNYENGLKVGGWIILTRYPKDLNFENIGGGKFENGLKVGKWNDVNDLYFCYQSQIQFCGEYKNGIRIGKWEIKNRVNSYQQFQKIGEGEYNDIGIKVGFWQDIDEENYFSNKQIIFQGNYENGIKVGRWNILFRWFINQNYQQIGEGCYDQRGIKVGLWTDIDVKKFSNDYQVLHEGQCNNLGLRIGKWKIKYRKKQSQNFEIIGGGEYDQFQNKINTWRDIHLTILTGDIIYEGKYNQGMRTGKWNILKGDKNKDEPYQKIGGGYFNKIGQKIGTWIELDESVHLNQRQVIWEGQYNNGVRQGVWRWKNRYLQEESKELVGGNYDNDGKKTGLWIEHNEQKVYEEEEILEKGYYRAGVRVGIWCTFYKEMYFSSQISIGGGRYDLEGKKVGFWINIYGSIFNKWLKFFESGNYKNGIKIGEWNYLVYDNQYKTIVIGGGFYNNFGQKNGYWQDIDFQTFNHTNQTIWQGNYLNDIKYGKWKILPRFNVYYEFYLIGGGKFNIKGEKIGFWKDLDMNEFDCYKQTIIVGQFDNNGFKIGNWQKFQRKNQYENFIKTSDEQNY